jgi:hypothetical protein
VDIVYIIRAIKIIKLIIFNCDNIYSPPNPSKQYAILRKIRGSRDQTIPGYIAPQEQIPWERGCNRHCQTLLTTLASRDSGNASNGFYRSKCTHTRAFDVIPAKGSFLLANYYVIQARESKTRYFEKFKINISSRRIHTKLSTRKRLNTKSILLYILSGNDTKV